MDNFMNLLKERRSIRNYSDQEIPEDVLLKIIEAVQWTQSWANTQCWEIIAVKDPEIKNQLQEAVPKANPGCKSIVNAPVVLALCGKLGTSGYYKDLVTTKFGDWFMFDLGLAAQSLCLAAHAQGLGTVVLGLFDHEKAKSVLNVPDGIDLVSLIPIGYPTKVPKAPKRKDIKDFLHHNSY